MTKTSLTLFLLSSMFLVGCGKKPDKPAPVPARTWQPLTIEQLSANPNLFQQRLRESNPGYGGGAVIGRDPRLGLVGTLNVPQISNLAGLRGIPFNAIDLRGSFVSDISALEGMPLRMLGLEGTRVKDLSPLKGMKLTKLYLSDTPVASLDALAGMPIAELMLVNTAVSDVGPLKGAPLTALWLNGTKVSDISALSDCPLITLTLKDTMVADLSPLGGHKTLERLHIGGTPVADISMLKGLKLKRLIFDPSKVKGWEAVVREMGTLKEVGTTLESRMPTEMFLGRYASSK